MMRFPNHLGYIQRNINLRDAAIGAGKEVVAHRLSSALLAEDAAVFETNRRPALNRKATILSVLFVAADEVGGGSFNIVTKLRFGG